MTKDEQQIGEQIRACEIAFQKLANDAIAHISERYAGRVTDFAIDLKTMNHRPVGGSIDLVVLCRLQITARVKHDTNALVAETEVTLALTDR